MTLYPMLLESYQHSKLAAPVAVASNPKCLAQRVLLNKRQSRQTVIHCRTLRDGNLAVLGPTESYSTSLERSKLNLVRFELKNDLAVSEIL